MPVVVVQPTMPIGPGDRALTPPTRMIVDFVNGRAPAFVDTLLNLVDVRDVAAGHLLAAARGRTGHGAIVAGSRGIRLFAGAGETVASITSGCAEQTEVMPTRIPALWRSTTCLIVGKLAPLDRLDIRLGGPRKLSGVGQVALIRKARLLQVCGSIDRFDLDAGLKHDFLDGVLFVLDVGCYSHKISSAIAE